MSKRSEFYRARKGSSADCKIEVSNMTTVDVKAAFPLTFKEENAPRADFLKRRKGSAANEDLKNV